MAEFYFFLFVHMREINFFFCKKEAKVVIPKNPMFKNKFFGTLVIIWLSSGSNRSLALIKR